MDILFAPDLASKPRSGNARSDHTTSRERHKLRRRAFDRETFMTSCPMPNDCCHRPLRAPNKSKSQEAKIVSVQMNHAQIMALSQNSCDGHDPRQWL
jgi:hypothetical protein